MTSDSTPPEGPAGTPGQPANETSAVDNAMADAKAAFDKAGFSTPEGMVGLAALILVGNWLIFRFLLERGSGVGNLELVLSVAAILLFFGRADFLTRIASKPVLLKTIGYALAVVGAFSFLTFLRSIDDSRAAATWISTLISFAGFTVAYLGARAIKV